MDRRLNELRSAVAEASKKAFSDLFASHPDEQFYGLALCTDDSLMTLVPWANSEESCQRAMKKYADGGEGDYADDPCFRWFCNEWSYGDDTDGHFDHACKLLEEITSVIDDEEDEDGEQLMELRERVFDTIIEALRELEKEKVFGSGAERKKITLFVTISDSDDAEELENRSAKVLNPKSVYNKFMKRFDSAKQAKADAQKETDELTGDIQKRSIPEQIDYWLKQLQLVNNDESSCPFR